MEFVTKLVEGKFPDYSRVIPGSPKNQVSLGRATLLACLQRTAIMTSDKFKGVRTSILCFFSQKKYRLLFIMR